jgi:hypothetical protein
MMAGIVEYLFLVVLTGIGTCWTRRWFENTKWAATTALFVGTTVYGVATLALLCSGVPFRWFSLLPATVLPSLIYVWFRPTHGCRWTSRSMMLAFGTATAGWAIARTLRISVFCFDSAMFVALGRQLARGIERDRLLEQLGNWGMMVVALEAPADLLGVEWFPTIFAAFFASFLALFFVAVTEVTQRAGVSSPLGLIVATVVTAFLATTHFIHFQALVIHNNLLSAFFLFGFLVMVEKVRGGEFSVWPAAATFWLGFSLLRVEAPLVGAALALVVLPPCDTRHPPLTLFALPVVGWLALLAAHVHPDADIGTPTRLLAIGGALVAATMLVDLPIRWFGVQRERWLPWLVPAVVLIVVGGTATTKADHLLASARNLAKNAFATGRWGPAWYYLVPALGLAVLGTRIRSAGRQASAIVTFLGLLFLFVCFRDPFRLGWGDSGNRIVTHVYPLLLYVVVVAIAPGLVPLDGWISEALPKLRRRLGGRTRFRANGD